MSDRIEGGGPAFPQNEFSAYTTDREGMNLRDWFAGQVIASVKAWHPADRRGMTPAQIAYRIADEMMEARK